MGNAVAGPDTVGSTEEVEEVLADLETGRSFTFPPLYPIVGGLRAVADPSVASWYRTDGIEATSLELVGRLLPVGGTFVDAGANIGCYTLAAAVISGPTGTVHAVEPSPATLASLRATVSLNGLDDRVVVHGCAVGAERRERRFYDHTMHVLSSFAVGPLHLPGTFKESTVVEERLDHLVPGTVDMIKLDVEGHEIDALRGAAGLFDRSPGASILCEVAPAYLAQGGRRVVDLIEALPTQGRSLWVADLHPAPGPARKLVRFEALAEQFLAASPGFLYANILSVPTALEGAIADLAS